MNKIEDQAMAQRLARYAIDPRLWNWVPDELFNKYTAEYPNLGLAFIPLPPSLHTEINQKDWIVLGKTDSQEDISIIYGLDNACLMMHFLEVGVLPDVHDNVIAGGFAKIDTTQDVA
jgi:hypothetical protein